MSNYHGRIMNMGHEAHYDQSDKMIARDVRHAAAEIANDADAEIAALEAERGELQAKLRQTEAAVRLANRETGALVDVAARHAAERNAALAEVERLRGLVRCLLDNEPDDMAADGVTVLDVWRKDARAALATPAQEDGG